MGGAAVNQGRNNAANGAAGALGEEGTGVIANQFNKKIWNALGDEGKLRRGFYSATNTLIITEQIILLAISLYLMLLDVRALLTFNRRYSKY
jgi:hypothetical protein